MNDIETELKNRLGPACDYITQVMKKHDASFYRIGLEKQDIYYLLDSVNPTIEYKDLEESEFDQEDFDLITDALSMISSETEFLLENMGYKTERFDIEPYVHHFTIIKKEDYEYSENYKKQNS